MSPDDPPKKPPRASWEAPDPDEKPEPKKKADKPKASWEKSDEKPTEKSGSWQPPPVEPPRVPKPRAQTAPPRASWETPAEGVPVAAPPKPAPVAAPIMAPTPTPAPAPVASPAMPPAPVTTTSMPVRDDAPFDPIPAGSPEIAPYDSVPSRDDAPYDPIPASAPENWQSSGTWESGSVSATAPIAAELPAPQSASVIVERRSEPAIEVPSAVTSAGMITPAAPA